MGCLDTSASLKAYLDDLLFYSKNLDDHCQHLAEAFKILREIKKSINEEKFEFVVREISYLRNAISEEGHKPDPNKTNKFKNLNIRSRKHLQKILGW